jgi:hypothetical protein
MARHVSTADGVTGGDVVPDPQNALLPRSHVEGEGPVVAHGGLSTPQSVAQIVLARGRSRAAHTEKGGTVSPEETSWKKFWKIAAQRV